MATFREKYNKKYKYEKDANHSISDISKKTNIQKKILQDVYNRGVGAHKTNIGSVRNVQGVKGGPGKKMSKEQWGFGRLYSFVMGGKTQKTTDKDLWNKHLMKEHSKHHTPEHIKIMNKEMKDGKSFSQAHKIAMKNDSKMKSVPKKSTY